MSELTHHGILGMKWGVRRYQNPDGTWTELGLRKRRQQEGSSDESNESKGSGGSSGGESVKKTESVKDLSDQELRERLNRLQMERQYEQLTNPQNANARNELQEKVNQLNLERQYKQLTQPEPKKSKIESGAAKVKKVLEIAAIGTTALGLYIKYKNQIDTIKKMNGGNKDGLAQQAANGLTKAMSSAGGIKTSNLEKLTPLPSFARKEGTKIEAIAKAVDAGKDYCEANIYKLGKLPVLATSENKNYFALPEFLNKFKAGD